MLTMALFVALTTASSVHSKVPSEDMGEAPFSLENLPFDNVREAKKKAQVKDKLYGYYGGYGYPGFRYPYGGFYPGGYYY